MTRQMSAHECAELHAELAERWPRIARLLTVEPSGWVDANYFAIMGSLDLRKATGAERAATCEELAAFYEWHLERVTARRGWDYLITVWTDSMCYSLRRSAAYARGEDPGPVIDQSKRRPDIFERRDAARSARDAAAVSAVPDYAPEDAGALCVA